MPTQASLKHLIKDAKTLKEADYTADSWKNFAGELEEAEEELAKQLIIRRL